MTQVVRHLEAQGGEAALLDLCRRFRECFMEALQPQVGCREKEIRVLQCCRECQPCWHSSGAGLLGACALGRSPAVRLPVDPARAPALLHPLQHLPAGWSTQHFGKRAFGEHSIYSQPGAR